MTKSPKKLDAKQPEKEDVERMYRVAYLLDQGFFRREDVIDFGMDLHRLKEFGEVKMKKTVIEVRKHVRGLWNRMTDEQRSAFMVGEVLSRINDATEALRHLEVTMGQAPEVHEFLDFAKGYLEAKIPPALVERLGRGSGKWRAAT